MTTTPVKTARSVNDFMSPPFIGAACLALLVSAREQLPVCMEMAGAPAAGRIGRFHMNVSWPHAKGARCARLAHLSMSSLS
jgi:hypothetical protein